MTSLLPVGIGALAGSLYFDEGERGIPTDSNCSYLSPASTDAAAWVAGAYLAWKGTQINEPLIAILGTAVAVVHVRQFLDHKSRRDPGESKTAPEEPEST